MLNDIFSVPLGRQLWYVALLVWVMIWKGLALWKSGRRGEKWWFIALFLVNTLGIMEILYIYVFSEGLLNFKKKSR